LVRVQSEHFRLPINEAAKRLGVCVTVLKKQCRKYGVVRWPFRKLRSIDKLVQKLERNALASTDKLFYQREIENLKHKQDQILAQTPTMGKRPASGDRQTKPEASDQGTSNVRPSPYQNSANHAFNPSFHTTPTHPMFNASTWASATGMYPNPGYYPMGGGQPAFQVLPTTFPMNSYFHFPFPGWHGGYCPEALRYPSFRVQGPPQSDNMKGTVSEFPWKTSPRVTNTHHCPQDVPVENDDGRNVGDVPAEYSRTVNGAKQSDADSNSDADKISSDLETQLPVRDRMLHNSESPKEPGTRDKPKGTKVISAPSSTNEPASSADCLGPKKEVDCSRRDSGSSAQCSDADGPSSDGTGSKGTNGDPALSGWDSVLVALGAGLWATNADLCVTNSVGSGVLNFHDHVPLVGDSLMEQVRKACEDGTRAEPDLLDPFLQARAGNRIQLLFEKNGNRGLQIMSPVFSPKGQVVGISGFCIQLSNQAVGSVD